MTATRQKAPRRAEVRIGSGEFHNPAQPLPLAQKLFIDAVARLVPDVLAELEYLADETPDDERLRAWARSRGFSDPWLLRYARRTVDRWRARPDTRGKFAPFAVGEWLPDAKPLDNPVWDSRLETETAFRERVEVYVRDVKGAEYARGAEHTPTKRTPPGEPVARHFEWLALYAVGGLTLDAIAVRDALPARRRLSLGYDGRRTREGTVDQHVRAANGLTPSAVWRGVRSAAKLAGVTVHARA